MVNMKFLLTWVGKTKPAGLVHNPDLDVRPCAVAPMISIVRNGICHRKYQAQQPRYDNRQYHLKARRTSDNVFVPRARTSMAQTRAFSIIGTSLWNQPLPSTRSTLLTGEPSAFFVLSRLLSSLCVSRTGSASDWCELQEALYKCIDTIQYNTLQRHALVY